MTWQLRTHKGAHNIGDSLTLCFFLTATHFIYKYKEPARGWEQTKRTKQQKQEQGQRKTTLQKVYDIKSQPILTAYFQQLSPMRQP
ncbi:hypothetical protein HanIR_Chr10g0455661 [Helianthus annuus]|nr:hypothetical protein HanIR_Chr10g0455661 [Helianthus annuus]